MSGDLRDTLVAAGLDPAALGPLASIVEAFDVLIQSRLDERAGDFKAAKLNSAAEAMLAAIDEGLHPDYDYLPAQAAAFLGVEQSTFNRISRDLLPRRKGGYTRGVDIMAYRGDISHEEARAYKATKQQVVRRLTGRDRNDAI